MPYKDPLVARARRLARRREDPGAETRSTKRWCQKNYELWKAYQLAYRTKHKQKRYAQTAEWRRNNVERRRAYSRVYSRTWKPSRRATGLVRKVIEAFVWRVTRRPDGPCYYCKKRVPISLIEFDHVIPIARGGAHRIENICTACRPCNRSKRAKLPGEWSCGPQMLLNL